VLNHMHLHPRMCIGSVVTPPKRKMDNGEGPVKEQKTPRKGSSNPLPSSPVALRAVKMVAAPPPPSGPFEEDMLDSSSEFLSLIKHAALRSDNATAARMVPTMDADQTKADGLRLELSKVPQIFMMTNEDMFKSVQGCTPLWSLLHAPKEFDGKGDERPFSPPLPSDELPRWAQDTIVFVRGEDGRSLFTRTVDAIMAQRVTVLCGRYTSSEALSDMLCVAHVAGSPAHCLGAVVVLDPTSWGTYAMRARRLLLTGNNAACSAALTSLAMEGLTSGALAGVLADIAPDAPSEVVTELNERAAGWLDAHKSFSTQVYMAAFASCAMGGKPRVEAADSIGFGNADPDRSASEAPPTSLLHLSRACGIYPVNKKGDLLPGLDVPASSQWQLADHLPAASSPSGVVDMHLCGRPRLWWSDSALLGDSPAALLQQPYTTVMTLVGVSPLRRLSSTATGFSASESIACWCGFDMLNAKDQADASSRAEASAKSANRSPIAVYHATVSPVLRQRLPADRGCTSRGS